MRQNKIKQTFCFILLQHLFDFDAQETTTMRDKRLQQMAPLTLRFI